MGREVDSVAWSGRWAGFVFPAKSNDNVTEEVLFPPGLLQDPHLWQRKVEQVTLRRGQASATLVTWRS